MTRPVPTMAKATVGPYPRPSPSVTPMVMTNATSTLQTGDRCLALTMARKCGNAPIRPIAYEVRDDTLTPALALAMVELTMARNTKNQNSPYSERARPSHDALPVSVEKAAKPFGPYATSTAYVVNTYSAPISKVARSTARWMGRRGPRPPSASGPAPSKPPNASSVNTAPPITPVRPVGE